MSIGWTIRIAARLVISRFKNSREPVKLILETTRLCNSHCKTCDMWQQQPPREELHPDKLLRAIGTVAENIYWIALTGGEVTLYPHLRYLVAGLVSRCPNLLLINIPLNGINPEKTAGLIKRLVSENRRVLFHATLSIDGIGEDQDALRGFGQWKQTISTWDKLRDIRDQYKNLRVSVQMTVSRLNVGKASEVMGRFAKESNTFIVAFGMDNRFYHVESASARQSGLVKIDTDSAATPHFELETSDADAVRTLMSEYRISGLGGFLEKLFLRGMLARLTRGSARVPCVAGEQVVFISAKGEVRPCPFFERSMGRLAESKYNLAALLKEPAAEDVRRAARQCEKCWNNCVGLPSLIASPVKALRLFLER
jgi:MoaA/NifB/PqqE/SkfB family radical SAM enzyme